MKKIFRAFVPFIAEVTHDFMLTACMLGPILTGGGVSIPGTVCGGVSL